MNLVGLPKVLLKGLIGLWLAVAVAAFNVEKPETMSLPSRFDLDITPNSLIDVLTILKLYILFLVLSGDSETR